MGHWTPELLFLGLTGLTALILLLPSTIRVVSAAFAKQSPASVQSSGGSSADSPDRLATPFSLRYTAASCAVFKPGCFIRVVRLAFARGAADIELSTEYLDGWGEVRQGIVAEAKGSAEEIESCIPSLSHRLADLAAVLSLSANAWVGDLAVSGEPNEPGVSVDPNQLRELDEEATGVLLERIGGHPEASTLHEVLQSYRRALAFWSPEQQPLALAHLHSGFLKMTGVLIGHLAQNGGLPRSGVARMFGVSQEDLPARVLQSELYRDDALCLHASRLAWQALASRSAASETDSYVVDNAHLSAARYLRSSILRVLELEPSCHSRLMAAAYDTPLGLGSAAVLGNSPRQGLFVHPIAAVQGHPQFRPGLGV